MAKLRWLVVVSPNSSFSYKSKAVDAGDICIGAESYDLQLSDILTKQDETAKALAASVASAIIQFERQRAVRKLAKVYRAILPQRLLPRSAPEDARGRSDAEGDPCG